MQLDSGQSAGNLPPAVIVGGSFHSLGAARNLQQHGVRVCVLDSAVCVSRFSRRVSRFIKCPPVDSDQFVDFLLNVAVEYDLRGAVLFPSTDDSVRVVSQQRERLSGHYIVTTPGWETVRHLYDKRLTHRLADQQGVPAPCTANPRDLDDVRSLHLDFPVVVKPAVSKRFMAATKKKAYRANDWAELCAAYEKTAAVIDPAEILVQELIPGRAANLYSFVGLFRGGRPVAGLSARRLRQHPMEFGRASTYVEVVDLPELGELATQLLTGIGYSGLAEVEFMFDPKDGRFELLEVNPRIWGWHTIAIRAGLHLPYLAYADAICQAAPQVGAALPSASLLPGPPRQGVKWVRLVTDLPTVLSEMLGGRLTLRQYLQTMSGDLECAVFSWRDPLPFLADVLLVPYNYLSNRGF